MSFAIRARFDAIREVAFGSIGATYSAIGNPITQNARVISMNNSTNVEVYISFDGTNNHIRLAANSFRIFDISTNMTLPNSGVFLLPANTTVYAKRVSGAPGSGAVWIEVIYGD